VIVKAQEHAGVSLRMLRALRSRVEVPSLKPCTKVRGFFDLGCCIKLAEHAGVSLRLHRALQSRVEAPSLKPCTKVRGFFGSGDCKSSGTRWRIPADAPRVAIPGRGTIIEALYESTGLFRSRLLYQISGTRWGIPAVAPRVTIPGRGTIIEALYESTGLFWFW
jgi:hypothetical protein